MEKTGAFGHILVEQEETLPLLFSVRALVRMCREVAGSVFPSISVSLSADSRGFYVSLDDLVSLRAAEVTVRRVVFGRKPYHERVSGFVMEAPEGVDYVVPYESLPQAVVASFEYLAHVKILEAMAGAENTLDMSREDL